MATTPQQFSLQLIFDAGVAFMGVISGGLKEIAPPEMPKIWVILGTITASGAFFSAKLLLAWNDLQLSRNFWFAASMAFVWLAVIFGVVYILTRFARTIRYEGETKLAGSTAEYLDDVANDPQNYGKSREELVRDAAGAVSDIWTAHALNRSRRILGIEYTLFISLLALGLYLGIEAYNTPKADPTFAELTSKLRDVHFALDQSDLSPDALDLVNADAEILKNAFQQYKNATVMVEGYCDDRGGDEYNFALGYKRAEKVLEALLAAQIKKERVTVASHGKKESNCQVNDESCRQKNRRVHLTAIQN
jgi:outer membrane protein OmpA-like peptidoglycan-associated protein